MLVDSGSFVVHTADYTSKENVSCNRCKTCKHHMCDLCNGMHGKEDSEVYASNVAHEGVDMSPPACLRSQMPSSFKDKHVVRVNGNSPRALEGQHKGLGNKIFGTPPSHPPTVRCAATRLEPLVDSSTCTLLTPRGPVRDGFVSPGAGNPLPNIAATASNVASTTPSKAHVHYGQSAVTNHNSALLTMSASTSHAGLIAASHMPSSLCRLGGGAAGNQHIRGPWALPLPPRGMGMSASGGAFWDDSSQWPEPVREENSGSW